MDQLVDVARCQCLLFHYSYAPRCQRLHDCTQVTYTDACSKELSHIIGLLMHMQMVPCYVTARVRFYSSSLSLEWCLEGAVSERSVGQQLIT